MTTRAVVPIGPMWRRPVARLAFISRNSDNCVLPHSRCQRGSYPIRADTSARCQALGNWLQSHVGLSNDLIHAPQRKAVDDLPASALRIDKAAVPQTGQVGADPGLGLADRTYELADSALLFFKELQDVQPRRISENPEKARRSGAVSWR